MSPDSVNVGTSNLVSEVEAMSNEAVTRSRRPTSEQRITGPSSKTDEQAAEYRAIVEDYFEKIIAEEGRLRPLTHSKRHCKQRPRDDGLGRGN